MIKGLASEYKVKECNQCGKCCIKYGNGGLTTSVKQIDYWHDYKPDVYKYVKDRSIFFDPETGEQLERCPWLRKAPNQNIYTCDIYYDRPDDCKFYPSTLDEMIADGCEMLEKKDVDNPKQGQRSLDAVMKDSWQEFEY